MGHSDPGSPYTSHDWQAFLKTCGLKASISCANCHHNAVAESFFSYSSVTAFGDKSMQPGIRLEERSLITSRCFRAARDGMVFMKCFLL